jgi:IS5 family transposase
VKKLLLNSSKTNQQNLFYSPLSDMLDMNDPLIALSNAIDWKIFENEFSKFYSKEKILLLLFYLM